MKRKELTGEMLRKWATDATELNHKRNSALYFLQVAVLRQQLGDEIGCFVHLFGFHFFRDEVLELKAKQAAEWAEFDVEAALLIGEEF